jgi:hypothetical protein
MFVSCVVYFVGSGLCDGLIIRSEERYRGRVSDFVRSRNLSNEAA